MTSLQFMACFDRKHLSRIKLNLWGSQARVPSHPSRHPLYFDHGWSWKRLKVSWALQNELDTLCVFWRLNREKPLLMGEPRVITINGIVERISGVSRWGAHIFSCIYIFHRVLKHFHFPFSVLPHLKYLHKHTVRQMDTDAD